MGGGDAFRPARSATWRAPRLCAPALCAALALVLGSPASAQQPAQEPAPLYDRPGGRVHPEWPPAVGAGEVVGEHPDADLPAEDQRLLSRLRLRRLFRGPLAGEEHRGQLMQRESWMRRPLSATWFVGGIWGSTLMTDWVDAQEGVLGGLRLGWDLSSYWGLETRLAFGSMALSDSQRAIDYRNWLDDQAGLPANHVLRQIRDVGSDARLFLWDLDVLFYPWGDHTWRPYLLLGLGTSYITFDDLAGRNHDTTQLSMPLGVGLKYRINKSLALRVECLDNIAIASGDLNTLHNLSLVGAAEFRFGASSKMYWPWNPGTLNW